MSVLQRQGFPGLRELSVIECLQRERQLYSRKQTECFPSPDLSPFQFLGFFENASPQAFSLVRLSPLRVSVTSRLKLFFWIYKILLDCPFSASVFRGLRPENASNTRLLLTLLLNGQAKTDLTCICDNFGKTRSMFQCMSYSKLMS